MPEQLSIFEPDPESPRGDRPPWVLGAIVLGTGLLLTNSIAAPLGRSEGLRVVQEVGAIAALVIAALQFGNSVVRVAKRQPKVEGMPWLAILECALLVALPGGAGVYALQRHPSQTVVLVCAVAVLASWPAAEWLEARIAQRLHAAGEPTVTEIFRERLSGLVADTNGGLFSDGLRWFLYVPPRQWLSRGRIAMCALLIFVAVGLGDASAWDLLTDPPPKHREAGGGAGNGRGAARAPARPSPAGADRGETARGVQPSRLERRWDETCSSEPGEGGVGVPDKVRAHIYALYLGALPHADPGPGADVAGCTDSVFTPSWTEGFYVTYGTDQTLQHRLRSVAVDSERFGYALFLAPAADPVRKLIRDYGPLGGSPRYPRNRGDFYVVQLAGGIAVLARAQVTLAGHPDFAEPYVYVPVAAVEAWIECMREQGRTWLWPLAQENEDGTTTFRLVDSVITQRERCRVEYDPVSERAYRTVGGVVRRYELGAGTVTEDELRALAEG